MSSNFDSSGQMAVITSTDGFCFDAFKASPREGESKGGLVVIQEIFGLTEQLKSVARSYAQLGFHTIVPSLFDRVARSVVVPFDEPDRGRELMSRLDVEKVLWDVGAAANQVESGRGVSAVGFCWGGGIAVRAAAELPLTAAVSYYGTRLMTFLDHAPACPMLFHFGETDQHSPSDVIEAVRRSVPSAEIHVYSAGHAFANDARPTYVQDATEMAGRRTLEFLSKHHGGSAKE